MGKLLVAVVAAAVLCGSAAAGEIAPPSGFTESAVLSRPVAFVAGKPAHVYCAATQAEFNAADQQYTGVVLGAGFTILGGDQTFLSPWVCGYLNRWLAKRPVTDYHLAVSVFALTHEAELQKGMTDESLADCAALAVMPTIFKRFFPLRRVYTIHDLMRDAWDAHDGQPDVYLTHCPKR
jgi:opacity protein-like surface antigen